MEHDRTMRTGIYEKKNMKGQGVRSAPVFEDQRIPTQVKLAGLWATVMFMYIYVDIIGFYQPGLIEGILAGRVWVFEITGTWMLLSLMLMTAPIIMVLLSLALPAKPNRYANIGLGVFLVLLALGMAMGEINAYYLYGSAVEIVLLSLIVWVAWKWPRASPCATAGN
ncbi:MAG: hypothetical protein ISF22_03970 [Methanomassiliicoccus sp.]|nr:hypothetical protein [Methanomassiliicoccus sp.]